MPLYQLGLLLCEPGPDAPLPSTALLLRPLVASPRSTADTGGDGGAVIGPAAPGLIYASG
ncbi:hypothetical protein GCM10010977_33220 [Citricoccus zhacaiensis]|uniref:Uncharacterized protein n=1 Tax=Citricoccus zhacaiensis TaxID=489142 RepID=A0ABQ2MDB9_9MICC|nr:hypothetical protein GCM10010977_33220 [Citricoccus zhacaiensis]